MKILNFLRGQAIDVIEWKDDNPQIMVYRYDRGGKDIMMGAQLTVRESQCAVMVNEGRIADVFKPGRYELSTQNMPIMTKLQSWRFGFNSPFKAEVYFINTRQFLDQRWGTSNPVMMRDGEFGMVRLRAFGIYSFRVADPVLFLKEVFGTQALMTTEGVNGHIKRTLVSGLSDALAQSGIPAIDMAANYDELSAYCLQSLAPRLQPFGLQLSTFVIENISLPEEVEKAMDRRTSMGVAGDLDRYTKFQAAEAMRDAANNQGAAGFGMAMNVAGMMGGMVNNQVNRAEAPQQPASDDTKFCAECGKKIPRNAKFCPECGAKQG